MGDEIDEILLLSLKDIGISLESLRDIDAATLVNAAVTPPPPPQAAQLPPTHPAPHAHPMHAAAASRRVGSKPSACARSGHVPECHHGKRHVPDHAAR